MAQISFPGPGHDGADDDFDMDAEMASYLAEIKAGREREPEPWVSPACTVSLGEAWDADLAELAAMTGPDGLRGETFAQHKAADAMRPGPVLSALAEQAAEDLGQLSDDAVLGLLSAARRVQNRAEYLELAAVAEFTRRRAAQYEADKARKVPRGCRTGEFADQELGFELVTTPGAAADRMDLAAQLAARLPDTFTGLANGTIDGDRAHVIWYYTRFLSDADAAAADKILAANAPELRRDLLAKRAARLEMKLDPEGVKRRKEEARRKGRRVEARREASGNVSLSGRELGVEEAMASKAFIDAEAVALRNAGLPGSLRELRVLVLVDRTQGRSPWDRLTGGPGTSGASGQPGGHGDPGGDGGSSGCGGDDDDDDEGGSPRGPAGPGTPAGGLAPLPALINLLVPAAALDGWPDAPGEAGTWGLTDAEDTRRLVQAASNHPRTRWCVTVTGPDGTAIAHGCARGQHPWAPGSDPGPGGARDGPGPGQAAQLAGLLRRLNVTFRPIARGTCDHKHQEDRYTPSRKLKHLVRARTATCSAPGCGAQAYHCDLDHTRAYPAGITCECGLGPACRRHHRCKQAPGWALDQPEPGIMCWTTPSGRTYTTTPTVYEL